MAFSVDSSKLFVHGAPASYFSGVDSGTLSAAVSAAFGEMSRRVGPRVGGPASGWTFTDPGGSEECTRDVCIVAASDLALTQGLTLPGEGADPRYEARAQAIRERWSRMGAPGGKGTSARDGASEAEPLYVGLVDSTPAVNEGSPTGWSGDPVMVNFWPGCGVV